MLRSSGHQVNARRAIGFLFISAHCGREIKGFRKQGDDVVTATSDSEALRQVSESLLALGQKAQE
jgi:hypothetical protein